MSQPCIICVAITGSLPTKDNNPAVPITIAEQIESTQEAFEAGATIAVTVLSSAPVSVVNTATISTSTSGDSPGDNSSSWSTTITRSAVRLLFWMVMRYS